MRNTGPSQWCHAAYPAGAMTRRLRMRLLGDNLIPYGGYVIPPSRIIELEEADAAAYLRTVGTRGVEILGWVEADDPETEEPVE